MADVRLRLRCKVQDFILPACYGDADGHTNIKKITTGIKLQFFLFCALTQVSCISCYRGYIFYF